jgi:hypothetical protein
MANRNQPNGAIKGRNPRSREAMPTFAQNQLQDAVLWVENGKYVPSKSCPSLTGAVTDGEASGININSNQERLAGVVVAGDIWEPSVPYTLSDSKIELSGYGCSDFTCRGAGATVFGGAELVLRNVDIATKGAARCATIATSSGTLRVYDSILSTEGGELPADYEPIIGFGMMAPPWPLKIDGTCRTHLSMDGSRSFFYNCDIYAAAWGAFSTDSSGGCLYLEANDSRVTVGGNGYCTYADNGCHNVFNGCTFKTGNMLAIQDGNSSITLSNCTADCGKNAFVLHGGLAEWVDTGIIEIADSTVTAQDDVLLAKSTNVDIYVKNSVLTAKNGAILHSVINDDPIYYERAPKGDACYGVQATFEGMELAGDILHEDTDRKMRVSLDNSKLCGRITGFPEVAFFGDCTWFATHDSEITLSGAAPTIDAPDGVTITVKLGEDGSATEQTLPSGGKLVISK